MLIGDVDDFQVASGQGLSEPNPGSSFAPKIVTAAHQHLSDFLFTDTMVKNVGLVRLRIDAKPDVHAVTWLWPATELLSPSYTDQTSVPTGTSCFARPTRTATSPA